MTTAEFDCAYLGYCRLNGLIQDPLDPDDYPSWEEVEGLMEKFPDKPRVGNLEVEE